MHHKNDGQLHCCFSLLAKREMLRRAAMNKANIFAGAKQFSWGPACVLVFKVILFCWCEAVLWGPQNNKQKRITSLVF